MSKPTRENRLEITTRDNQEMRAGATLGNSDGPNYYTRLVGSGFYSGGEAFTVAIFHALIK